MDTTSGCSALEHIAPIYFAIFVLATQFVLLNVVVAVLMKHLEDAKEEGSLNSSRDGDSSTLAMQTDGRPKGQDDTGPDIGTNNNAMTVRQGNDSDSSLSSIEYTAKPQPSSADSRYRLPPVDHAQSDRSTSLATLRLPPIGSQSSGLNRMVRGAEKVDDSALSELPSPENEHPAAKPNDGHISPRAPIYVMSEDSDMYDSNMDVDRETSKVFRPVDGRSGSQAVRSPSPHSSSEEEGKNKPSFKKSYHKSETKKGKSSKTEPKPTASVSPRPDTKPDKQETKPVKPDARWASPVLGSVQQGYEIKLSTAVKPENDDGKDNSYQMQSYV